MTAAPALGAWQIGFLVTLVGAGLWSSFKRADAMTMTFVVLVLNVLAGWAAAALTGSKMPLLPMIFIDTATAALILWFAKTDEQIGIGWLLFVQIAIHIVTYAFGAPVAVQPLYSNAINAIGWGQILLLMIGTHDGSRKRLRVVAAICRHLGVHSPPAAARSRAD